MKQKKTKSIYKINQYSITMLGKNHKKHLAIAILTKETQAIKRNNLTPVQNTIQPNKVMYYTTASEMKHAQKQQNKNKRKWY